MGHLKGMGGRWLDTDGDEVCVLVSDLFGETRAVGITARGGRQAGSMASVKEVMG